MQRSGAGFGCRAGRAYTRCQKSTERASWRRLQRNETAHISGRAAKCSPVCRIDLRRTLPWVAWVRRGWLPQDHQEPYSHEARLDSTTSTAGTAGLVLSTMLASARSGGEVQARRRGRVQVAGCSQSSVLLVPRPAQRTPPGERDRPRGPGWSLNDQAIGQGRKGKGKGKGKGQTKTQAGAQARTSKRSAQRGSAGCVAVAGHKNRWAQPARATAAQQEPARHAPQPRCGNALVPQRSLPCLPFSSHTRRPAREMNRCQLLLWAFSSWGILLMITRRAVTHCTAAQNRHYAVRRCSQPETWHRLRISSTSGRTNDRAVAGLQPRPRCPLPPLPNCIP